MVETLDTEIDEFEDDVVVQHFRTDEPTEIQVAQSAGNPVMVETAHFIAASVDSETDEMSEMMTGQSHIDESSVFISNEDGDVGGGFIQVDGGDLDDAISEFEDEHLGGE